MDYEGIHNVKILTEKETNVDRRMGWQYGKFDQLASR